MTFDQQTEPLSHAETPLEWTLEPEATASALTRIQTSSAKSAAERLKTKNIVMHSQGGMGKTVIASLLAQYLNSRGHKTVSVDADPMNNSLARYKALYPTIVKLMDGDSIDAAEADACFEWMMDENADFVFDCGSSGFIALATYLKSGSIIDAVAASGCRFYLHTVIVGNDREDESTTRANDFVSQMPASVNVVLWLNPYFGRIRYEREVTEFYRGEGAKIVRMPDVHPKLEGADLAEMFRLGLTFDELAAGVDAPSLRSFSRMRLGRYWEKLTPQIAAAVGE